MDCSWLVDYDCNEGLSHESDPEEEETQAELESRLYSIIHHSDLSQPLPPELAKDYSIQCGEDGLTVALNNTLENIQSEETKKVDQLLNDSLRDSDVSEIVEIDCSPVKDNVEVIYDDNFNTGQSSFKRFRYSDVNIDSLNVTPKNNVTSINGDNRTNEFLSSHIDFSDLNYFEIPQYFFKKKKMRKLKYLMIPESFSVDKSSSDWKDSANESFISVGEKKSEKNYIILQMVNALKTANPKESSKGKLYTLARALYMENKKKYFELKRGTQMRSRHEDKTFAFSEVSQFINSKSKNDSTKQSKSIRNEYTNIFDGSVCLNISPFKPLPPTVDLVSEDEDKQNVETYKMNEKRWKSLPKCEVPAKWSKKMIKFYTKPSQTKMDTELNDMFENLKNDSTVNDWKLDPRDERGFYQKNPLKGKFKNRRCPNCQQLGHLMHECPSPRKTPTCFLCGLSYHTAYSCPNKICLKCGTHVSNDSYECKSCYYSTFHYDTPCDVCGQDTHRTEICPDLWRSFHATVEGEKKVPELVMENKRKYCCNCANKGHFSHQCPFPTCDGERLSSFVTNYSASSKENGSSKIVVPRHSSDVFTTEDADQFLQNLSNSSNAVINFEEGPENYVFQISGTFAQCSKVRGKIEEYINTKKRKRKEPYLKNKRRRRR